MRGASLAGGAVLVLMGLAVATSAAAQAPAPVQTDIDRGKALATANCSSCHAVTASGASPNRRAPPFRTLSGRYVELTLHRKLTEFAETGHYDMPPVPIHTDEVDALAAYINSLCPTDAARRR